MIHYHGGPITPDTCAVRAWSARHAFISYADHRQIGLAAEVCQSFALDNGAFSFWKSKKEVDWLNYYNWVSDWIRHPGFDFAVVPDIIEGTEKANNDLAQSWPFARHEGGVVWHTNESVDRLIYLANTWPIVCIGSSGAYDVSRPATFLKRIHEVLPYIIDSDGYPICKLHGLRMLNPKIFSGLPLSSADSTNAARNIGFDQRWKGTYQPKSKETRASILVERIEYFNGSGAYTNNGDLNVSSTPLWGLLI